VMHINLHKTFSTPHGGGGPGSGPICVRESLAPFLPVPVVMKQGEAYHIAEEGDMPESCGRIRGFHGQFGMYVRALAYILSHGADGLRQVSEDAVLNANYILSQLQDDYFAPFPAPCMHECLLTDRNQREGGGVQTLDIAKTLIEYGFHPMTVYFPATRQGAMLIEPTETESKRAIDKFIDAMRRIARDAKDPEKAAEMRHMPLSAPRRRLDEVQAARRPVLRWKA